MLLPGAMKRTPLRRISKKRLTRLEKWRVIRNKALWIAGGVCQKCGKREPYWHCLHVHHFRPRSLGGTDVRKNLRVVCPRCHAAIHDHTCSDWNDWIDIRKPLMSQ